LPRLRLQAERIFTFMQRMESAQAVFQRTGATHSAAIFEKSGNLLGPAEDIGRHNALDKVIGMALQNGTLRRAAVATMTSRLSCELVNKAAAAGFTFLCGISVATNLAVELAEKHDIILVVRVLGGRMNICTHRERIIHELSGIADQANQRISA
jgi:FdhD protein